MLKKLKFDYSTVRLERGAAERVEKKLILSGFAVGFGKVKL